MPNRLRHFLRPLWRRERGSVAVEFAIIFPILALVVFGAIDFGHAWYMRHVLQNGCREGARYGSRYQTNDSGGRVLPSALTPSISNFVLNSPEDNGGAGCGVSAMLPAGASPHVTPSGPAWLETDIKKLPLEDLKVTVTARKTWFILHRLVPGITSDHVDITVAATMKCE